MSFDIHLRRCGALALLSLTVAGCGGSDNSAVTPVTATPTFSVAAGAYTTAQSVTLADTTSGAVIYCTTDGTTPTITSPVCSGAISVTGSTTIAAIALAPSHTTSAISVATYLIGPAAAAAGIWVGQDSEATPEEVLGFVTTSGQSVFIRVGATNADLVEYSGPVMVSGTAFTSALDGFSNFPYALPDNSTSGIGTFDATIAFTTTLNGALTFTSSANTSYPSNWSLNYSQYSLAGSSLATVAGTYTDASTMADPTLGATITISAAGVITSTAATSGCVMSGSVGTSDPITNIYEFSFSLAGCTGQWAALNSVVFSGLGVLNPGNAPVQLDMGVNGESGGTQYGLVLAFNQS
jgi:hypothetical protein